MLPTLTLTQGNHVLREVKHVWVFREQVQNHTFDKLIRLQPCTLVLRQKELRFNFSVFLKSQRAYSSARKTDDITIILFLKKCNN